MPELDIEGRPISWVRDGTIRGRPLVVLGHGAGAPYTSPFMAEVARGLVARGLCVVRFHFPYMEAAQRAGTKKPPDPAKRLITTWRAVIDQALALRGHGPLVIGGKSMGGRMASMLLAEGRAPEARGAVYLGYPLHPPSKPEKLRADHLSKVPVPQLFVSGEKDALCEPAKLRAVLKKIPGARHLEIAGADHSLARSRKDPLAGADEWLDAVAAFVKDVTR
jgi:predicted alpha/beta-hydrolase family hydrolase